MGQHPKVIAAMEETLHDVGAGSGGTRNIGGNTHYHIELEGELADLHGKQGALLFTSGYISNEATLATLGKLLPGCIIFSDELNHASMIAGIRNSGCESACSATTTSRISRSCSTRADPAAPKLIAFESVYSMDGDVSPIAAICDPRRPLQCADLSRRGPCRGHVRRARRRHFRGATRWRTG
ncbi:MAG: aminotransferase class I/II-fold pyridoxal phosphate-dependent enzyme [Sphingomonas sp.]